EPRALVGPVNLVKQDKKVLLQIPVSGLEFDNWPAEWRKEFGASSPTPAKDGWLVEAQVKIATAPGAPLTSVASADGKPLLFALFPDEQRRYGGLTPQGTSSFATQFDNANNFTNSLVVRFGSASVFAQAYPGFNLALQSGPIISISEVDAAGLVIGTIKAQ